MKRLIKTVLKYCWYFSENAKKKKTYLIFSLFFLYLIFFYFDIWWECCFFFVENNCYSSMRVLFIHSSLFFFFFFAIKYWQEIVKVGVKEKRIFGENFNVSSGTCVTLYNKICIELELSRTELTRQNRIGKKKKEIN